MADDSPTLAALRHVTLARNRAEKSAKAARLEQLDAIVAAHAAGDKQKDIVEVTGLTRERIRQICLPATGRFAEARLAIKDEGWLEDMARASLSAAEAKFAPPAQPGLDRAEQQRVIDDVMTREPDGTPRRKSRSTPATPHRCPPKGWCETCGEWKGGKS